MIIDVDTGIDDAMAILVLKLDALTTTFGNTDTALATTNTLQMLELLKQPEIPVAKGVALAHSSLRPPRRSRPWLECDRRRRASGEKIRTIDEPRDLIIRMAKESTGELMLCQLGPITNLARASVS